MSRTTATIRVDLAGTGTDPAVVARALAPDDTPQMTSRLDGTVLETRIERGSVGGLRSTVDDYVVNCRVATRVAGIADDAIDTNDTSTVSDDIDVERPGENACDETKRQE